MKVRFIGAIGLFLWATCLPVQAQEITATLRGRVLDPGGAPLPGVPVTVSSGSRGEARKTVMTDLRGRFKFPLLPPASDYFLLVSYPGFAAMELGPIDLDAGKTTLQEITLSTSDDLTEKIEVNAHGSVVDTESTRTSSTFNSDYVQGLPIIGRNYQDILTLTPGVTDTDGDGNPNVQGARETEVQYRLDGGNITDPMTGTFGQNLNIDAIEEMEIITAGAGAEFGRASGGFANIITKSGGNDFEGAFRMFWRGHILDGDGARENNDTFVQSRSINTDVRDLSVYLTLGGALKRDKIWYFTSIQYQDREVPVSLAGASFTRTTRGRNLFGKITWQVNADNKVAVQYNDDPYQFSGGFLGFGVEEDSDALVSQGGQTSQFRWTSILSPTLLMETLLTHFDSGIAISPVSDLFHEIKITTRVDRQGSLAVIRAQYPVRECSTTGEISGFVPNCNPARGRLSIYQVDSVTNSVSGPFFFKNDDERLRNAIKSDLTYTLEDRWGEHQIKAGIEFADETYRDQPLINPLFINNYEPCRFCLGGGRQAPVDAVTGFQVLQTFEPSKLDVKVTSFSSSAYVQDLWKPLPNLTIQAGLRIDREDIDSQGFTFFQPGDEKRKSIAIVEGLCDDAVRVARTSGLSNGDGVCDIPGRIPGQPPVGGNLVYTMDGDTPEDLRDYDVDGDGVFDSGIDGPVWFEPFSAYPDRAPESFTINNLNLSPRVSVSWDPRADGRTKLFGTWGRFHSRLLLTAVDDEMGPDNLNFTFRPDPSTLRFMPNMLSVGESSASVFQVDRDLRTPFTDVFTLGFEREVAAEWSVKLTYIQRLAWDLLQDTDANHLRCEDFPEELGIRMREVCPFTIDANGRIRTSDDLFGDVGSGGPNRAPDLYILNRNFNQVLRISNSNSSRYRSLGLEINRRLHRNWQASLSYTWSRAQGQAESFLSVLGDDPSTVDDERGFLNFDQRHRVILIATTHLPRDVELGTTIEWVSGTPFSIRVGTIDADDAGNVTSRTFFPTGQRNDQRNDGFWGVDLKVVKRFNMGGMAASASLAVNNLMNADDVTLSSFRPASSSGTIVQGPQGLRRFGRFWELGFTAAF